MKTTIRTIVALLGFLAAARMSHAADAAAVCTRTTTIRADGAIVTHTVCVAPLPR